MAVPRSFLDTHSKNTKILKFKFFFEHTTYAKPLFSSFFPDMASQLSQLDRAELSKIPTVSSPPGATVNFDGPNSLESTMIIVTSIFMGLAFLFVGIRAYTKIKIYGKGSWDDRRYHVYITFRRTADIRVVTCAFGFVSLCITLCDMLILIDRPKDNHFGLLDNFLIA